jgi:hypothetical protein
MCCIYTKEYYSTTKKNDIMSFAGKWVELEIIMLSEIIQAQKDLYSCSFAASRPNKIITKIII